MSEAVIGGVIHHVSPSQINTYRRCKKRWWYEKILRLSRSSSFQQNAGTGIHKELETYFDTKGACVQMSKAASAALEHLPPTDAGFLTEAELTDPDLYVNGVKFTGFVDLIGQRGDTVEIYDYKTCSSWRYCQTKDELRTDVQQGSYAKWATLRFPEATKIRVALVYIRRDSSKVRVVAVDLERSDIDAIWTGVAETVDLMKQTAAVSDEDAVETNVDACGDYGGCPFFGRCRSLADRFDIYPETVLLT